MQNTHVKISKNKIIAAVFLSGAMLSAVPALALADFNPSKLIEDSAFTDTQTFGGAAGIQQFLVSKGSVLANTDPTFLLKLQEPQSATTKTALGDPEPSLGRLRTAAELIWDSASHNGMNPQVILVTLQKEQSLITGTFPDPDKLQKALNRAMGFNCPDASGCTQLFAGFYFQLFGNFDAQGNRYIGAPASLMRSYNTAGGRGPGVDANNQTFGSPTVRTSKVGDTIIIDNTQGPPNNAPANQSVTLSNLATAALYRYTPHVYNGNFNFVKFFTSWFKYPNGTLLKVQGDSSVYIVTNGLVARLTNFVMLSRGLNPATANFITISPTELGTYDQGQPFPPPNNTIVFMSNDPAKTLYVFQEGIMHPVSAFVLKQRGLNANNALSADPVETALFSKGAQLTPSDGTLIKGSANPTVYIIQNGKRLVLTGFTFGQYGYSFKNVENLPQAEVDSYAQGGFVLPKNGTLLTLNGGHAVYLLKDQLLEPISYNVFQLYKYSFKNVVNLNSGDVANAAMAGFVPPPDSTYYKVSETGDYFYYKDGTRHLLSPFVLAQRKVGTIAVVLSLGESLTYAEGSPLTPKDGTLIKGDTSQAIFVITKGLKVALDFNTWVKTYAKKAPSVLPQAEVDSYQSQNSTTIQQ